jgi:formylglycine-generating enzyme required for sulfatase activity
MCEHRERTLPAGGARGVPAGLRVAVVLPAILAAVLAAAPAGAAPAAAGSPHGPAVQAGSQCAVCHVGPVARVPAGVLGPACGRCHGPELGVAVPVSHLGGGDKGPTVRPDPELARDLKTITADMILVPGGPFVLGDDTRHRDEGPMQPWTVPAFYIDKLEVTNADYDRFARATERGAPEHWGGPHPPGEIADHPVTYVSWYDGRDYCAWRGKRLPTEFEWEKAARGTDGLKFPWGDIFDPTVANTPQSGIGHTTPVGSFPKGASPYGVLDMAGNVWEWTDSWYKPYPGNARSNPNYGELYRVVRGGSWYDCEIYRCGISAPTFNRGFFIAETKNDTFGFRCALTAPEAAATETKGP